MVSDVTLCGVAVAETPKGGYYYTMKLAKTMPADTPVDKGPLYGPNSDTQSADQPNQQPADQPNQQPADQPNQ